MPGALTGLKVVEFVGLGPAPFACALLADHGAEVVGIVRPGTPLPDAGDPLMRSRSALLELDLKAPSDQRRALSLIEASDILVEGFRPGVMERACLGPAETTGRNPRLVYARMTGWGQSGPRAHEAGHDINYIAPSGILAAIATPDGKPIPPLNVVGDLSAGSMFLVTGILAAIIARGVTGRGQVVDAAICDGAAYLDGMIAHFAQAEANAWDEEHPGTNIGDGGRHYYNTYRCLDGRYIAVGAVEPQFYAAFREVLGLTDPVFEDQRVDGRDAERMIELTAAVVIQRTRDEWCALVAGRDACITPVLTMSEARSDAHNAHRGTFVRLGGKFQPSPAPLLATTPAAAKLSPAAFADPEQIIELWRLPDA